MRDIKCYENLANAIILQAAKDYRTALNRFFLAPYNIDLLIKVEELERFFRSEWFMVLSDMDGPNLMRRIHDMVKREVSE